jgi:putative intracellular protease/amidase
MAKKILMVLTSHSALGDTGKKTGFWLEEFAAPYYVFLDAGADITLASPQGGQPPLDPKSDDPSAQTDATRRFKADAAAQKTAWRTRTSWPRCRRLILTLSSTPVATARCGIWPKTSTRLH